MSTFCLVVAHRKSTFLAYFSFFLQVVMSGEVKLFVRSYNNVATE